MSVTKPFPPGVMKYSDRDSLIQYGENVTQNITTVAINILASAVLKHILWPFSFSGINLKEENNPGVKK